MTEVELRRKISLGLLAAHFFSILLVIVLWASHGFTFSEMTTTVAVLMPIFATHTTSVANYVVKNRIATTRASNSTVTGEFRYFALSLPTAFVILTLGLILLKAFNLAFATFDEFKISLALCEAIFGVYLSRLVAALYKS